MNLAIADMIRRNSSQEIVVEYDAGVGELGVLIRDSCIKYCPVVSLKHLANNIELNLSSHGLTTDYYQIKYKFQSSHKHLTSLIEENGPGILFCCNRKGFSDKSEKVSGSNDSSVRVQSGVQTRAILLRVNVLEKI